MPDLHHSMRPSTRLRRVGSVKCLSTSVGQQLAFAGYDYVNQLSPSPYRQQLREAHRKQGTAGTRV